MPNRSKREAVRAFYEQVWNEGRLELIDELFASTCTTHQVRTEKDEKALPRSPDQLKEHVAAWREAFPDLHYEIEALFEQGDRVVVQWRARGTHRKAFLGIEATGKQVEVAAAVTYRFADGKIQEDRVLWDRLGFFRQLGHYTEG